MQDFNEMYISFFLENEQELFKGWLFVKANKFIPIAKTSTHKGTFYKVGQEIGLNEEETDKAFNENDMVRIVATTERIYAMTQNKPQNKEYISVVKNINKDKKFNKLWWGSMDGFKHIYSI